MFALKRKMTTSSIDLRSVGFCHPTSKMEHGAKKDGPVHKREDLFYPIQTERWSVEASQLHYIFIQRHNREAL